MHSIAENIADIKGKLGPVKLVVVSKFRSNAEILEAYQSGHRAFAENRVQALLERYEALPKDIEWHLIGHLQTNKVKYIAPFISMIHSVDSERLLMEINKYGQKNNRIIDCLLQIFVAREDTKFGMEEHKLFALLAQDMWHRLKHVRICGIMAMASLSDDSELVHSEFEKARNIFDKTKSEYFGNDANFCHLSIGMSSDFEIAIQHGSTMVRIGSKVFDTD